MITPDQARAELVRGLCAAGVLEDGWLAEAFEQVPRHLFVPDIIWQLDRSTGDRLVPLRRDDDPDHWLDAAYQDRPVDIQVDDGYPADDGTGFEVTSSASQPSVVADMLRCLDAEPGSRVLEIGTGTGWNAALLAHRVGAENVVSVEIDPAVAEHARHALDQAGYGKVKVVTTDGAEGWPSGAPYDRVIATVGVREVPYAWVEQSAPGGRIVAPLTNTYQPPGVAVLSLDRDGRASGHLAGPAAFMELRAQREPRPRGADFVGEATSISTTDLHPYLWAGDRDVATAIGQQLGNGIHTFYDETSPTTGTQWLYEPETRSWASVDVDNARTRYTVRQAGQRPLFAAVHAAYRWWLGKGRPTVSAWRVVVDDAGQTISLRADTDPGQQRRPT